MGDDSEVRQLRKDVARLQSYIEDQRRRHSAEVKALRQDLDEEYKYSKRLRKELDEEYAHGERLQKELDGKRKLAGDLRYDLDDERHYSDKLERKLDKRMRQLKKLEAELLDLEDDYAHAYKELKRMDVLRKELENMKLLRLFEKQKVSKLQEEVHSLRGQSRSPTPPSAPTSAYIPTLLSRMTSPRAITPDVPMLLSRMTSPRAVTPELESDYTEEEELSAKEENVENDVEDESDDGDDQENSASGEEDAEEVDHAPGQKMRGLAAREGRLADREFQRAREAFESGDKAFAKQLKDSGMQHRSDMQNYHRMAAAEIFIHHNPEYHSNPNSRVKVDLHHLHVNEAKEFVEKHVELCRAGGLRRTEIICGRGNHSAGGVAKLRPAVIEYLGTQHDVVVDSHDTNPGRIVVGFSDSWTPSDDGHQLKNGVRPPQCAEIADVFEQGRTRLRAATKTASEVRQGLEEIEKGVSAMKIRSEERKGLREVTNRKAND
ncbi:hypothetical protein EW145_g368 [Phellinidium pouzarii]|uniref:Smr domain-containing protein n=1 Tax=Phellinidium pouzarii TaxID=167371 RepID=A0A4S4LIH7_9AGAM|nr:hypothetical protein EW145_g368 [Phellinidium pouzarii]